MNTKFCDFGADGHVLDETYHTLSIAEYQRLFDHYIEFAKLQAKEVYPNINFGDFKNFVEIMGQDATQTEWLICESCWKKWTAYLAEQGVSV